MFEIYGCSLSLSAAYAQVFMVIVVCSCSVLFGFVVFFSYSILYFEIIWDSCLEVDNQLCSVWISLFYLLLCLLVSFSGGCHPFPGVSSVDGWAFSFTWSAIFSQNIPGRCIILLELSQQRGTYEMLHHAEGKLLRETDILNWCWICGDPVAELDGMRNN